MIKVNDLDDKSGGSWTKKWVKKMINTRDLDNKNIDFITPWSLW